LSNELTPNRPSDSDLGMDRPITRRDFVQGVAVSTLAGPLLAACDLPGGGPPVAAQDTPGYYPPLLNGLRGSHPGSFEAAHALRDGQGSPLLPTATHEHYDLIVVGGGISGLTAAHLFRQRQGDRARVLVLDNHDDFGGHAKRNEFSLNGRMRLMNGGTLLIDSPRPYGPVAAGVMKSLGIDPVELSRTAWDPEFYAKLGMKPAAFLDRETFGVDKLLVGIGSVPPAQLLAGTPFGQKAQDDFARIEGGRTDFLPGLTSDQKKDRLSRISYEAFLRDVVKADPLVVRFYAARTHGEWGVGTDAISALDCWGIGMPGFAGMNLSRGATPRMGFTPAGYADTGGSPRYHFPDGNASIARLLVRSLVPEAVPGSTATDVVTARVDYAKLDRPSNAARIRLNSLVTRVRNIGDPKSATGAEVTYVRGGRAFAVSGKSVVLACYNHMIPYLCPELPEEQKKAQHELVKTPLVYTSVALRNWQAFHDLGVDRVYAPGGYHSYFFLDWHTKIGNYESASTPDEPTLVHLVRTPCKPGLSEHDQHRAGRAELLATPFATFEREIRSQLGRVLAGGGFDPARDITAITVNRWPHGYAPEYNALWDPEVPEQERPWVKGRQRFGRIAIANSDAGGGAYTDVAMEQGARAVDELLG
jgi:spermidine dehydrogenase